MNGEKLALITGLHVALLEPGTHVGGMVSGGLSHSDVESREQLVED